eukprot:984478-Heterocapsa_arctica.AAC.1
MRDAKKFHGAFQQSRNPTHFVELVTCDHIISKSMEGLTGDKDALDTLVELQFFQGAYNIKTMYSDNSGEIIKACKKLKILREPSRPGVPE